MGKKKKHKKGENGPSPSPSSPRLSVISKRGWKIIGLGAASVVLGFLVLTMTDPRGQNAASFLSPLLILGGYALIGLGIVTPDRNPADPSGPSSQP